MRTLLKTALEGALMLFGVFVFFVGLSRFDVWGMLLGGGLVFAPLAAGAAFLIYAALICIPFGLGFIFMVIGKELFGAGIMPNLGFVAGIVLGGMFVVSDTFNRIIDSFSAAAPQKETPPPAAPAALTPRAHLESGHPSMAQKMADLYAPFSAPAPRAPEKNEEDWSWTFIGAISGLCALFFYFKAIEKPVPPPAPPPAQVQQQVLVPLNQPVMPTRTRKHRNNSDLRHCLNLPTNAEIIRCANQGQ